MKPRLNTVVDSALETQRGQLIAGGVLVGLSLLAFVLFTYLGLGYIGGEGETFVLQLGMALVSVPLFGAVVFLFAGSGMGFPGGLRYGVVTYIVFGLVAILFGIPGGIPGGVVNAGPFWPFFLFVVLSCAVGFGPYTC